MKILKVESYKTNANDLIADLKKNGYEVYVGMDEIEPLFIDTEEDQEMLADIKKNNCTVYIVHPQLARYWWFTDGASMGEFFANGGKLNVNEPGFVC